MIGPKNFSITLRWRFLPRASVSILVDALPLVGETIRFVGSPDGTDPLIQDGKVSEVIAHPGLSHSAVVYLV